MLENKFVLTFQAESNRLIQEQMTLLILFSESEIYSKATVVSFMSLWAF